MHPSRAALARLLLALAILCAPAAAGVLVVDVTGGGDFTSVAAAVAAAAEGDTLLVRPGPCTNCYDEGFAVNGKSLTIVFDSPLGPSAGYYFETIAVMNLQPGQLVVLRGLRVKQAFFESGVPGITLIDNAGAVWIEDCELRGGTGNGDAPFGCGVTADLPGGPAIRAADCAAVTVVGCELQGGTGKTAFSLWPIHAASKATDGGTALLAIDSSVAVYGSTLTGGVGGGGHLCSEIADGGPGADASGSKLLLSGCTVTGGVEGSGPPVGIPGGGLRGDAISSFELLDTSVAAAPGGTDFETAPGTVSSYPGDARLISLPSPLREGEAGTFTMQGAQGDFVAFFWSFDNVIKPMPARNGWFLLGGPFIAGPFLMGTITDPSGLWQLSIHGPTLPAALQAQTFLLQAYFKHTGGVTLGGATAFTLVDASF